MNRNHDLCTELSQRAASGEQFCSPQFLVMDYLPLITFFTTTGIGCITIWKTRGNEGLKKNMNDLAIKVESLDNRFGSLDNRFGILDNRVGSLDIRVGSLVSEVGSLKATWRRRSRQGLTPLEAM